VSSFILVCPITSNPKPWPFKIALPKGADIMGYVLVDQIKSIDKQRIVARTPGALDLQELRTIRLLLAALLGIEEASP
jgi:mRNA interferase MazF